MANSPRCWDYGCHETTSEPFCFSNYEALVLDTFCYVYFGENNNPIRTSDLFCHYYGQQALGYLASNPRFGFLPCFVITLMELQQQGWQFM